MSLTLAQVEGAVSLFVSAVPEVQSLVVGIAKKSQAAPTTSTTPTPAVSTLPNLTHPDVTELISFLPELLTLEQGLAALFAPPIPPKPATAQAAT